MSLSPQLHADVEMAPGSRDVRRPLTKDESQKDHRYEEDRKRRDELKSKPDPPPRTRTIEVVEVTKRPVKDLPDIPMVDATCDPTEQPQQLSDDLYESSKVLDFPSRRPGTTRELSSKRNGDEADRCQTIKSVEDRSSGERVLVSRTISNAREEQSHSRIAGGHASQSHGISSSRGPATKRAPKDETFVQKASKALSWWIGGQMYEERDPASALPKYHAANLRLEKDNYELQKKLQALQGEYAGTNSKMNWLERENRRLLDEQEAQSSQVRVAQELVLKNDSLRGGLADEDRTVRQNLRSLQTDVKNWGKDWAHSSMDSWMIDSLQEKDRTEAYSHLAKIIRLDTDHRLPAWMSATKMANRTPQLVLSALLSNALCEEIFARPFRLLEASTADVGAPERRVIQPGNETLDKVYNELVRYDEAKAQIWRCHALEILDPLVSKSQAAELAKRDADRRRKGLGKQLTDDFLKGPALTLLRLGISISEEDRRFSSLERIIVRALQISARLWKQLTIMRCNYLGDLNQHPFRNGSELLEAHQLHRLGVHGEDEEHEVTRLDGRSILMVVAPAIIALGNNDGENYNTQHRVWAKGVVLLDE